MYYICNNRIKSDSVHAKQNQIKFLITFLLVIFTPGAQCYDTAWVGGANTLENAWESVLNWSNGSPDLANNITIGLTINSPIINNINIQTQGNLTLDQGATLQLISGSLHAVDTGANFPFDTNEIINGNFTQSGGTHTVDSDMRINAQGQYALTNGNLTATRDFIDGNFSQNGGTNVVSNGLIINPQGQYTLVNGNLTALDESIAGKFSQTGGTNNISIGFGISGGTYLLSGGNLQGSTSTLLLIISNDGKFIQNGGSFSNLGINIQSGQFILNDGNLNLNGEIINGIFTQNGGVKNTGSIFIEDQGIYDLNGGALRSDNVLIGERGPGEFNQNNGLHIIANDLNIGSKDVSAQEEVDGPGAYNLKAGTLEASNENIGWKSLGTFNQTGGINTVRNDLNVGADITNPAQGGGNAPGTYNLQGGTLQANNENIGLNSPGTFNQTGGTNIVNNNLTIAQKGTYVFSGGELRFGNLINNGNFIQSGGSINGSLVNNEKFTYSTGDFSGQLFNNNSVILDNSQSETLNVNITGTGSVIKENGGTTTLVGLNNYTGGTIVSNGVLRGDTNSLQGNIVNNATLAFNQANSGIFDGVISGSGKVVKQNNGLLIFNGTNSYTGGTQINSGALQIGNAAHPEALISGPVTINSGGILSGHGTVNGNIENNGTLSPGGSIGTLTVNGNVNFSSGSTFTVEIDPQQSSLLNVSGLASLGNAKVSVIADPGGYSPRSYTILNARGINGRFGSLDFGSTVSNPSLDVLTPSLQYLPNRVNLSLNVISNPAGPLRPVIDTWFETTLRTLSGRLNAPLGVACPENTMGFWARGIGMVSSADTAGTAPGYDGGTAGTVLGFDGQFGEHLTLGLAGFYANSDVTTHQLASQHSTADSLGVSAYAAFTPGAWQFKGVLGYDHDSYRMQRTSLGNIADLRIGKTQANHVNGYGEISYSFKTGKVSLQPLVGLQMGWMRQDGFTETSNNRPNQNLSLDGRTLYTLDVLAGLRARQEFEISETSQAQVELRLLYDHDFSTRETSMSGRFNNRAINDFNTSDRPNQLDAGIFGASIAWLNADSVNLYLDYNGEIRGNQQSHFIGAGLRYSW